MFTALASKLDDMQAFPLIMNFLVMPIFFLSGALFPLDRAPNAIQLISKINPSSYGVDGLREYLIGVSHLGTALDLGVLLVVTVALTAPGSYFFSKIEI